MGLARRLIGWYVRATDAFSDWTGLAFGWLTTGLVLVVCYDVVMRYIFGNSKVAVQELQWHIFSLIFLLGAAYTLRHDKHVRVDIFYARLSPRKQAIVNLCGCLLLLLPFAILIITSSWDYVRYSYQPPGGGPPEVSPNPGGLPGRWILKGMIPLCFVLLTFQGLATIGRSVQTLCGREPSADGQAEDSAP